MSESFKKTWLPLLIAFLTFLFTVLIIGLEFIRNLDYRITDDAKFAIKDHQEPTDGNDPSEWLDSPIIILGITESSEFNFLKETYGQYPWPREAWGEFLSYFRFDDPRLQAYAEKKQEDLGEIKELTWNSIIPELVFIDIFFDGSRKTKISFDDAFFKKDFGGLLQNLDQGKKPSDKIIKDWAQQKKSESDKLFFDELNRQKDKNYVFVDYALGTQKTGRLDKEDVKERYTYLKKWELKNVFDIKGNLIIDVPKESINYVLPPIAFDIKAPLKEIGKNIAGLGPANILSDPDGKRRRMPLIYRIFDERFMVKPVFIPTIGLVMAMKHYDVKPSQLKVELGKFVTLQKAKIKKRLQYVRKGAKTNKLYEWDEYVDFFMSHIIKKMVTMAKAKGKESGKFSLKYSDVLKELLADTQLQSILEKKYRKNNINKKITPEVLKSEIADFLTSLSKTSYYKRSDFFLIEEKKFEKIDFSKIKDYLAKEKKQEKVLSALIKDDGDSKQFSFLDHQTAKIAYRNISYQKDNFFAQKVSSYVLSTEEEKAFAITDLQDKGLISYDGGGILTVKVNDINNIIAYQKKLTDNDMKTITANVVLLLNDLIGGNKEVIEKLQTINAEKYKSIIGSFINVHLMTELIKDLSEKKIILYKEKQGDFFNVPDEASLTEFVQQTADKEKAKIIEKLNDWGSLGEFNLNEFYNELKVQDKIEPDIVKGIVQELLDNDLITLPLYMSLEVPDFEKLTHYRDNTVKDKKIKNSINQLIKILNSFIKDNVGKKYYTLPTKKALPYLQSQTGLSAEEVKEILQRTRALKLTQVRTQISKVIELDTDELRISNPKGILKSLAEIAMFNRILTGLIEYPEIDKLSYYQILLELSNKTQLPAHMVEEGLEVIKNDLQEKEKNPDIFKLVDIKESEREIKGDIDKLWDYRLYIQDIKIPVDDIGQLIINFQGKHQSFENDHFGKYMGLSRLRYVNNGQKPLKPFDMENETKTPAFEWSRFKNKFVFVGFYTTAGLGTGRDHFETPYGTLYGIEIHANAFNTIIQGNFIEKLPENLFSIGSLLDVSYEMAIMFLFVMVFGIALPRLTILRGFLFFFATISFYILLNFLYIFPQLLIDIPLVGTILVMFFAFISLTVYKLMTEEKDKRKIKGMFSKYVSEDVVNTLLASGKKLVLGGEDRELTVLFSDIRGFTALSEKLGNPQDLVNHLNIYYSEMTEIVIKYKGTLDKYIGDAMMAFWGAPLDITDHALLACKSALEMMSRLEELNVNWPEELKIDIGIGLNTGKMTVGNMGSSKRMDYTIMGDPVNLGSRVEGVNKMYGTNIIITEFTYELIKEYVTVRHLDLIRVKGKLEPVTIYELLAIKE